MKLFPRHLRSNRLAEASERFALHVLAIVLGVGSSLLAVLAVAAYEGYLTAAQVWNMAPTELGTFAALAAVGGIGVAYAERSTR